MKISKQLAEQLTIALLEDKKKQVLEKITELEKRITEAVKRTIPPLVLKAQEQHPEYFLL